MKLRTKSLIPLIIGIGAALIVVMLMYYPTLQGKTLGGSNDIVSYSGNSKEVVDYSQSTGEKIFWTGTVFSGMPVYQMAFIHTNNLFFYVDKILSLFMPYFMAFLFLTFMGFYVLSRVLKMDNWISILGAVAFSMSSYFMIIIAEGHSGKAHAIAYMAPYLLSVFLAFRGKYLLGGILSAVFLALELTSNHIQITYYLAITTIVIVLFELVRAIMEKQIMRFVKACVVLLAGLAFAVAINFSNLYTTNDYSKQTIRGESELSTSKSNNGEGLDKEYITAWSYGIGETWSLMIPNVKGGSSMPIQEDNKELLKDASPEYKQMLGSWSQYWGEQPFTSGPVYAGAIVMFLFVLGLFIVRHRLKWPLLIAAFLAMLLAWGSNFSALTNFFIDNVPLYNKFRAPAMWLVVVELIIPIIMVLGLHELITNREKYAANMKWVYISFGLTGGLALLFWLMPSAFFSFISSNDQKYFDMFIAQGAQQVQIDGFASELAALRISIFRADAIRSFLFILAGGIVLWLFLKDKIKANAFAIILIGLILIDMVPVNKRYLNESNFVSKRKYEKPFSQSPADQMILQDNVNDARVLNLAVNTFNDASTSYYHKSVGGYSAVKLMRYQELIENQISPEINMLSANLTQNTTMGRIDSVLANLGVLNMLNTRYLIINANGAPLINSHALGHAWFAPNIVWAQNADEEIQRVGEINTANEVVIDKRYEQILSGKSFEYDSMATLVRTTYSPNELTYESNSATEQFAVFSEIYYPEWEISIDGQAADLIRVNYVLRGAVIPAGAHKIEMKIRPKAYIFSSKISLISSIILLLGIVGYAAMEYRKTKKKEEAV
ncbi:MAG: hypothetical protein JXR53_12125 [Bacteroidales bacterium]|nr:hypothetical protein [Bacteroidales bacterium]